MRHEEDTLQMQCVSWFGLQYPDLKGLLHHSPNGGKRNLREAARFKAMGTRAGFPDLALLIPRGERYGLFIEMKTATGRQTTEQRWWQAELELYGYRYEVCRSLEQFIDVVNSYLL